MVQVCPLAHRVLHTFARDEIKIYVSWSGGPDLLDALAVRIFDAMNEEDDKACERNEWSCDDETETEMKTLGHSRERKSILTIIMNGDDNCYQTPTERGDEEPSKSILSYHFSFNGIRNRFETCFLEGEENDVVNGPENCLQSSLGQKGSSSRNKKL